MVRSTPFTEQGRQLIELGQALCNPATTAAELLELAQACRLSVSMRRLVLLQKERCNG
jgi:hypothetical protein